MSIEKEVDESWKETAQNEKIILGGPKNDKKPEGLYVPESDKEEGKEGCGDESCGCSHNHDHGEEDHSPMEINFINYISSLGFQAMIFLGEIVHPMTNKIEKNIDQAKFIIDTLVVLREKTKGNLTEQEQHLLDGSVYELQLKYVEIVKKEEVAK